MIADFADGAAFFPRVTVRDGRAIDEAIAGQEMFGGGVRLDGAVVEATFAAMQPPLLSRLVDRGARYFIDPETLRFSTPAYEGVERLRRLPYAPDDSLVPESESAKAARAFATDVLRFQLEGGASAYVAPAVP